MVRNIFNKIAQAFRHSKILMKNGSVLNAYDDALHVYDQAIKGKRYNPDTKLLENFDPLSIEGKDFIKQAELRLNELDKKMDHIFPS